MTDPTIEPPPPAAGRRGPRQLVKGLVVLLTLAATALVAVLLATEVYHLGSVDLPMDQSIQVEGDIEHPPQNWKYGWGLDGTQWFHHANQGTKILPYAWFMALERPEISPFAGRSKFVEGDYLYRFGFIRSEVNANQNPDNLPIGFSTQEDFVNPDDPKGTKQKVVGLTCAACHTGEVQYTTPEGHRKAIRIEGGPAMINLGLFEKAIGLALYYTDYYEVRFNRFADDVLGADKGDSARRDQLRADLRAVVRQGLSAEDYEEKKGINAMDMGYARTDALGLIGNRVFGPLDRSNLIIANAPVNFPHLWDTAWFDWVQYNASIRMPLVRNIGEVLGVGGLVNLDIPESEKQKRFPSSVNVENLHLLESLLGGKEPFGGLRSPKWTDTGLPPIKAQKRDMGEGLYRKYCVACHLPPPDELQADAKTASPKYWYDEGPKGGPMIRVLRMPVSDLQVIGTDPNEALNFYARLAKMGDHSLSAAKGLYNVTGLIRNRFLESRGLLNIGDGPDRAAKVALRLDYDRNRPFDDKYIDSNDFDLDDEALISKVIVPRLGYKARPLNGIWATAPFLHNGSIPNLDELLKPASQRSSTFYLGSKQFDPEKVGFEVGSFSGGFRLDTTILGNTNVGHEYRNLEVGEMEIAKGLDPPGPGDLRSVDQRWADVFGISISDWKALDPAKQAETVRDETEAMILDRGSHTIPKGVIGPALSPTERDNLVEYLKTL